MSDAEADEDSHLESQSDVKAVVEKDTIEPCEDEPEDDSGNVVNVEEDDEIDPLTQQSNEQSTAPGLDVDEESYGEDNYDTEAEVQPASSNVIEIRQAFSHYDKDSSGEMDAHELSELCNELGTPMSEESLLAALDALDQDHSGKINFDEFTQWYLGRNKHAEESETLVAIRTEANKEHALDIHIACWNGDVGAVNSFAEMDHTLVNAPDDTDFGMSYRPIHYAAYQGHLEVVQFLLSHGANSNARTSEGCTALFLAAQQGHAEVVDTLVRQGGSRLDIAESKFGLSPLEVATDENVKHVLEKYCITDPPLPLENPPSVMLDKPGVLTVAWRYDHTKGGSSAAQGWKLPIKLFLIRLHDATERSKVISEHQALGDVSSLTIGGVSYPQPIVATVSPVTSAASGDSSGYSEPVCAVKAPSKPPPPSALSLSRTSFQASWKVPVTNGCKVSMIELYVQQVLDTRNTVEDALGRNENENQENNLKEHNSADVEESEEWKLVGKFPSTVCSTTVSGLEPCTSYRVRVVAQSAAGPSKPSRSSDIIKTKGMPMKAKAATNKLKALLAFKKL